MKVSPEYIAEYRKAQSKVGDLAVKELTQVWKAQDLSRPEQVRDALLEHVPGLTQKYGSAAAALAADWYDLTRADLGVMGRFMATVAPPFPAEGMVAQVRYGAAHLFTPTPEQTLEFLAGSVQKHSLQPARETIRQASLADPAARGWQRIASGTACEFCVMLEGRGAVYTEESVAFDSHGHCHCTAVPVWD